MASKLAAEVAYAITGSNSVAQQMIAVYQSALKEARSMDGIEGFPEKIIADDFINIRF